MSLLQSIHDFFESIFKRSSPEVQKKQAMKKLESEFKNVEPAIYKSGYLLPNFAEAINSLYRNTIPLDNLFLSTIGGGDVARQKRYEAQLIITAYSVEDQTAIDSFIYENRKQDILLEINNPERVYQRQRKLLEKVLKELNSENFKRMDKDILELRQFSDFCHTSLLPLLQMFDLNYQSGNQTYHPTYTALALSKAVNVLEDIYYGSYGLKITTTIADQVMALAQLRNGNAFTEQDKQRYIGNLKKINYVITKVLTSERLKTLIRLAKQNTLEEPRVCSYTGSPRQDFANMLQARFDADEQRIKSEIQDERIGTEVAALFHSAPLDDMFGYNAAGNLMLQNETPFSFMWILPMRILKTFLKLFVTEGIKSLLNDIVIEGFFTAQTYKSNFSQTVYSVINAEKIVQDFEDSFGPDQRNSIAVMESYIKDSAKDRDFYKKLERMVLDANNEAHKIIQSVCTTLSSAYRLVGELLQDAKKPSSEIIDNLKVLMMSSRNRDNTNLLEEQYPSWKKFFEIMRNYVIINSGEIQS